MNEKESWYCLNCGSDEIHHDATAQYNADTQTYEVVGIQDGMWCVPCLEDYGDLDKANNIVFAMPPTITEGGSS